QENGQKPRCSSELVVPEQFHGREKPYKCLKCGKSFSPCSSLLIHLWVHVGGTP
ncbi:ZN239 protein, partial [Ploceus nigricollis]|nr:ZN239 protein [Ploceus nigricollis]